MSIRGFHIIFVIISTLLCVGVSLWVFLVSGLPDGLGKTMFGGGAALAALALPVYGVFFYSKIKKLNI